MIEIFKVICIKSYTHYKHTYYTGSNKYEYYTKGKQYDMIIESSGESCYIVSNANYNTIDNGIRFFFEEKRGLCEKFGDYFITLAEWRDKQINTIFEDGEDN